MLNRQKTFDTVLNHLREQGKPALREGSCAYRGFNGTMCAIGCLIPEDEYYEDLEGKGAAHHMVLDAIPGASANDAQFLFSLQRNLHDSLVGSPNFLRDLEESAQKFAENHNGVVYIQPE